MTPDAMRRPPARPDGGGGTPLARAEGLAFRYPDGSPGLRLLSLAVRQGEVLGLLGPNGSGKSTLLRLLADGRPRQGLELRPPAAGRHGRWLAADAPSFRAWLTGRENAEVLLRLAGLDRRGAGARVDAWLDRWDLAEAAERPVAAYSSGMRRRLVLAVAFAAARPLTLLDEPVTGLDPRGRAVLAEALREAKTGARSVVLSAHEPDFAAVVCDRVAFLVDGECRVADEPARLVARVGGGARIEIRFVGGAPPDTTALAAKPGVLDDVLPTDGGLLLRVGDVSSALPAALGWLLEGGARIERVEIREPSLEDAFFELTGRQLVSEDA